MPDITLSDQTITDCPSIDAVLELYDEPRITDQDDVRIRARALALANDFDSLRDLCKRFGFSSDVIDRMDVLLPILLKTQHVVANGIPN